MCVLTLTELTSVQRTEVFGIIATSYRVIKGYSIPPI